MRLYTGGCIALASKRFVNGNTKYNTEVIRQTTKEASEACANLVVFGESFLQGFDALCWEYEKDRHIACARDEAEIRILHEVSSKYEIDLLCGYIEREDDAMYSSAILISGEQTVHNYRRVSMGWKEASKTDQHYREGDNTDCFSYLDKQCKIALCGDLWDAPERFSDCDLLFWPVYVDYSPEEWNSNISDYAIQAAKIPTPVLMVNSLSDEPRAYGGAYCFLNGKIIASLPPGKEGILYWHG